MQIPFKVPVYHPLPAKFYLKPFGIGVIVGIGFEIMFIKMGYYDLLIKHEQRTLGQDQEGNNK